MTETKRCFSQNTQIKVFRLKIIEPVEWVWSIIQCVAVAKYLGTSFKSSNSQTFHLAERYDRAQTRQRWWRWHHSIWRGQRKHFCETYRFSLILPWPFGHICTCTMYLNYFVTLGNKYIHSDSLRLCQENFPVLSRTGPLLSSKFNLATRALMELLSCLLQRPSICFHASAQKPSSTVEVEGSRRSYLWQWWKWKQRWTQGIHQGSVYSILGPIRCDRW